MGGGQIFLKVVRFLCRGLRILCQGGQISLLSDKEEGPNSVPSPQNSKAHAQNSYDLFRNRNALPKNTFHSTSDFCNVYKRILTKHCKNSV